MEDIIDCIGIVFLTIVLAILWIVFVPMWIVIIIMHLIIGKDHDAKMKGINAAYNWNRLVFAGMANDDEKMKYYGDRVKYYLN